MKTGLPNAVPVELPDAAEENRAVLELGERLVLELMPVLLAELGKVEVCDSLEIDVVLELALTLLVEPREVTMVDALEADIVLLSVFTNPLLLEIIVETLLEEDPELKISTGAFGRVVVDESEDANDSEPKIAAEEGCDSLLDDGMLPLPGAPVKDGFGLPVEVAKMLD